MRVRLLLVGIASITIIGFSAPSAQAQAGVVWRTTFENPIAGARIGGPGGGAAMNGNFVWSSFNGIKGPPNWPNQVMLRVTDSNGNFLESTGIIGGKGGGDGVHGGAEAWSGQCNIPLQAISGTVATLTATGNVVTPAPPGPPTSLFVTSGSTTGTIN